MGARHVVQKHQREMEKATAELQKVPFPGPDTPGPDTDQDPTLTMPPVPDQPCDPPVLLVHGFASSAEHNWRRPGWLDLLADLGRETIAVDLPGHGRDVTGMVFRRLAEGLGNDRAALIAFLRRPQRPLTAADLARISPPVLVVLGDQDPAGPGDGLVAALPAARLVTLRGVDHFGTPADVRCMQAVLDFLAG